MKLIIRSTLNRDEAEIEVEDSESIESVRAKAHKSFPDLNVSTVKLIWRGKILGLDKCVKDFPEMKEGERLVIVGKNTKTKEAAPAASGTEGTQAANVTNTNTQETTQPLNYDTAASTFVSSESLESTIQGICQMGFERPDVERALAVAFNNPDRAVDLLTNGLPIPANPTEAQAQVELDQRALMREQLTNFMNTCASRDMPTPTTFEQLKQHPLILLIRRVCREEPAAIADVLQFIGQISPNLLGELEANRTEFLELLEQDDPTQFMEPENAFYCTNEEAASIERLESLGFPRMAAVQAFVACDRNEELAANFLLENAADYMFEEEVRPSVDDASDNQGGSNNNQ